MSTVLGWFLLAMFVWGCCIVMQAFQRRVAPEMDGPLDSSWHGMDDFGQEFSGRRPQPDERDREIADLQQRIEVLEAIVTDRRYQWDREFSGSRGRG